MENPKVEIRGMVATSSLDDDQKMIWDQFLEQISDQNARLVLQTLQDSPIHLQFLSENFQKKFEALKDPDSTKWSKIIAWEKDYLSGLDENANGNKI